jgi:uncharacterized protein (DUF1697 family)
MPAYAAFLRGVSPVNAKMPELRKAFARAGFSDVKTVLSSGNVVFTARATSEQSLERKAGAAMKKQMGRSFFTIVRPIEALRAILATDPFRGYRLPSGAKRVVTFLHDQPPAQVELPI